MALTKHSYQRQVYAQSGRLASPFRSDPVLPWKGTEERMDGGRTRAVASLGKVWVTAKGVQGTLGHASLATGRGNKTSMEIKEMTRGAGGQAGWRMGG